MPDILLQDYLEEISNLIDESRLGEAVRHCRFILEQYPRHVDTYRLLGKAFLEQGELESAADVFQRVLSADPEDFIAHAGLAILFKQKDQFKQAVWHMERAFEVDPYNAAIQEALKDLYGRRDGLPPGQLPLTRGALSRLHVNGEMYTQAISELRELLQEDESRIDLQTLLAEALWRDGQRVDAVEICLSLLEKLPYCIKANAILGEVWLMTGREDEATTYVQRVYDLTLPALDVLDDDSPVSRLFRTEGAMELLEHVFVEHLGETEALGLSPDVADWVQDLDLEEGELLSEAEPEWLEVLESSEEHSASVEAFEDDDFDWLRDVAGEGDSSVVPADSTADHDREEEALSGGDTPDAERQPDETEASGQEELKFESTPTRWLDPGEQSPELGATPEEGDWEQWLEQEQAPDSEALTANDAPPDSTDSEEVPMGATDEFGKNHEDVPADDKPEMDDEQTVDAGDDSFDWLEELGDADESESSEEALPMNAGELPDWLVDDADAMAESDEPLEWLDDDEENDVLDEGKLEELPGGELPDWLRDESTTSESEEEEDLSWLDQIAAGEGAPIEEPATLSWPDEEDEESAEPIPEASEPEGDQEVEEFAAAEAEMEDVELAPDDVPVGQASGEVSDEAEAADEVPEDLEDAMAWLEQLAAQQGAPMEELPSLSELDELPEEGEADEDALLADMPEDLDEAMAWLDDLSDEQAAVGPEQAPGEEVVQQSEQPEATAEPLEAEEIEGADWLEELAEAPADSIDDVAAQADAELETAVPDEPEAEEEADITEGEASGTDWLEQLAARQSAPTETPPVEEGADEADALSEELGEPPVEKEQPAAVGEEEWEELDWLEDLGDDVEVDEAWLDELATTEEQEVEAEIADDQDLGADEAESAPEDLDEAMAWLEQLAARQGAPADELPSLEDLPEREGEAQSMADLEEIPEDPEAALAWLESLAQGEAAEGEESEVVEEPSTPAAPQDVVAARAEAEAILLRDDMDDEAAEEAAEMFEEMPEDPDEAMAWLERLAARQGAPLDELPSVTTAEEDVETPEWIARQAAEEEAQIEETAPPAVEEEPPITAEALSAEDAVKEFEAEEIEVEEPEAEEPDLAQMEAEAPAPEVTDEPEREAEPVVEEVAAEELEEAVEDEETEVERALMSDLVDDELEESLPSWLALEEEGEAGLDWEEADTDIASWLQAEEEATQHEMRVPTSTSPLPPEPGEAESATVEEVEEPTPEAAQETPAETVAEAREPEVREWASAVEGMDHQRLEAAREALQAGNYEAALDAYNQLLQADEGVGVLVADLETATSTADDQPQLWQLLGDAYMQNGQLQKALDAYRQSLDLL